MKLKNSTNGFAVVMATESPEAVIIARNIERWHQEQAERARAEERKRNEERLARMHRHGQEFIGRAVAAAFRGVTL
jgi:uncharacterized FlaG/YvyC family protein